ncbi:MAG: SDR family oxidoreductase [Planctomycetes bacterium]|nr:SDR family oxidoreductase [Planctomycetota bacterium]
MSLVTGSSRGIGRAIALELARRGSAVAVNHPGDDGARALEVLEEARRSGAEALEVPFDVSDPEAARRGVRAVEARWGRLDVLVNNAGTCTFHDVGSLGVEEWDRTFAVNARGPFLLAREAAAIMRLHRWGRIINVTSISGLEPTSPLQVAYCASKAAANMLTRSLALILAPQGITVNAVLPGTVPTEMNRAELADPAVRAGVEERTPLGRLGTCEEVAAAVGHLASPAAAWITGALWVVDGGFVA